MGDKAKPYGAVGDPPDYRWPGPRPTVSGSDDSGPLDGGRLGVPKNGADPAMTRSLSALLVAVMCAVALETVPASLGAQLPRDVRVYPRVGLLAPDAYFYEYFENFAGDGLTEWTHTSLGRAFIAGVGVEMPLGKNAFLRGEVLRSFDTWLSASHSQETLRDLFTPPEIVTTWLDVPTTLTITSLQLVLPTRLELGPAKPYVLVGGGGKFYSFRDPLQANEVGATLPSNGFTWGADLGAGFTGRVRGLHVDVQVRDALSRYWGKYEHDFIYSGSVSLRLF